MDRINQEAITNGSRLIAILPLWARWMRTETIALGYPTHSAFLRTGGGHSDDSFTELCDSADAVAVRTLDTLIDGLPAIQRAAVWHVWAAAVWRFRDGVLDAMLSEAYERLDVGMRRWGMW